MTISDLIKIVSPEEFREAVVKVAQTRGLTDEEMLVIVRRRSQWLCDTYRLTGESLEWHRKVYGGRK